MKEAKVMYCGHSTVIVTTELGKRAVIDPFFQGNPKCPPQLLDPGSIDYIFLTHGHSDHTSSTMSLAKKYGSQVFATFELAVLLMKDGIPEKQMHPMNKGGSLDVPGGGGLRITLTQAFHSSSYDAADGQTYYAGEPCGVALRLESRRCLYHAGDTCLFRDMELIGKTFQPEVALLPIGDRFTMGPQDAAVAADYLGAKAVIPIHYGTFPMLTGTPEEFVSALNQKKSKAVVLSPGDHYSF